MYPNKQRNKHTYIHIIHSFISIQEPEPSHVTGMALAHCILGNYLGVVCHCFPPPLDFPTFVARCLYVRNVARDPSSERWNCGRKICPVILPKFRLPREFRDVWHAKNLRHGTDGFTSPPKEGVLRIFFRLKNPTASAGFEPANLGTKDQHATPRPPKPIYSGKNQYICHILCNSTGNTVLNYKLQAVHKLQNWLRCTSFYIITVCMTNSNHSKAETKRQLFLYSSQLSLSYRFL